MTSLNEDDQTLPVDFDGSCSTNLDQLVEVTFGPHLEYPDGSVPMVTKAGSGRMSPVRSRTMKEYDQQLADLKKENFSLKLRIYFLEERVQQKFDGDSELLFKTNIELKVEVESLKKELLDKQDLLKKASSALESISAQHQVELQLAREQLPTLELEAARRHVAELESKQRASDEELRCCRDRLHEAQRQLEELVEGRDRNQSVFGRDSGRESALSETSPRAEDVETAIADRDRLIEELRTELESRDEMASNAQFQQLMQEKDEQIQLLKSQLVTDPSSYKQQASSNNLADCKHKVDELEEATRLLTGDIAQKNSIIAKLEDIIRDADASSSEMSTRIKELQLQNENHEANALKHNKAIGGLVQSLHAKEEQLQEKDEQLQTMAQQLTKFQNSEQNPSEDLDRITELESMLEDSRQQNNVLQENISQREAEIDRLMQQLGEMEEAVQQRDTALQELRSTLQSNAQHSVQKAEALAAEYKTLLEDAQAQVENQERMLQRFTRSMQEKDRQLQEYMAGDQQPVNEKREAVVNSLRHQLQEKDQLLEDVVQEKYKAIEGKEMEIRQLKLALRERDQDMERANQMLLTTEETIDTLESEAKEKEQHMKQVAAMLKAQQAANQEQSVNNCHALEEKEAIIQTLRNCLEKKEEDLQALSEDAVDSGGGLAQQLQQRLHDKEMLLQDVMSERSKLAETNQQAMSDMLQKLQAKDDEIKKVHDEANVETAELHKRLHVLQSEMNKKDHKLQITQSEASWTEEQQHEMLEKMRSALKEKDKTIEALMESGREKDKLFCQLKSSREDGEDDDEEDALHTTTSRLAQLQQLRDKVAQLGNELQNKDDLISRLEVQLTTDKDLVPSGEWLALEAELASRTQRKLTRVLSEQRTSPQEMSKQDALSTDQQQPGSPNRIMQTAAGSDDTSSSSSSNQQQQQQQVTAEVLDESAMLNAALQAERNVYVRKRNSAGDATNSAACAELDSELSAVRTLRVQLEEGVRRNAALHARLQADASIAGVSTPGVFTPGVGTTRRSLLHSVSYLPSYHTLPDVSDNDDDDISRDGLKQQLVALQRELADTNAKLQQQQQCGTRMSVTDQACQCCSLSSNSACDTGSVTLPSSEPSGDSPGSSLTPLDQMTGTASGVSEDMLRSKLQQAERVNAMLKAQIQLDTRADSAPAANLNPQLIVQMAQEIERLKDELATANTAKMNDDDTAAGQTSLGDDSNASTLKSDAMRNAADVGVQTSPMLKSCHDVSASNDVVDECSLKEHMKNLSDEMRNSKHIEAARDSECAVCEQLLRHLGKLAGFLELLVTALHDDGFDLSQLNQSRMSDVQRLLDETSSFVNRLSVGFDENVSFLAGKESILETSAEWSHHHVPAVADHDAQPMTMMTNMLDQLEPYNGAALSVHSRFDESLVTDVSAIESMPSAPATPGLISLQAAANAASALRRASSLLPQQQQQEVPVADEQREIERLRSELATEVQRRLVWQEEREAWSGLEQQLGAALKANAQLTQALAMKETARQQLDAQLNSMASKLTKKNERISEQQLMLRQLQQQQLAETVTESVGCLTTSSITLGSLTDTVTESVASIERARHATAGELPAVSGMRPADLFHGKIAHGMTALSCEESPELNISTEHVVADQSSSESRCLSQSSQLNTSPVDDQRRLESPPPSLVGQQQSPAIRLQLSGLHGSTERSSGLQHRVEPASGLQHQQQQQSGSQDCANLQQLVAQQQLLLQAQLNATERLNRALQATGASDESQQQQRRTLIEHLEEIRALRLRLEQSIQTNDLLRVQLEKQLNTTSGASVVHKDPGANNQVVTQDTSGRVCGDRDIQVSWPESLHVHANSQTPHHLDGGPSQQQQQQLKQQKQQLDEQMQQFEKQKQKMHGKIQKLEQEKQTFAAEVQRFERQKEELEQGKQIADETMRTLEAERRGFAEQMQRFNQQVEQLQQEKRAADQKTQQLEEERRMFSEQMQRFDVQKKELTQEKLMSAEKLQRFEQQKEQLLIQQKQHEQAKNQLEDRWTQLSQQEEELRQLRATSAEKSADRELQKRLDQLQQELEERDRDLATVTRHADDINRELVAARQGVYDQQQQQGGRDERDKDALDGEIEDLRRQVALRTAEVHDREAELSLQQMALQEARHARDQLAKDYATISDDLDMYKTKIETLTAQVSSLTEQLAETKHLNKTLSLEMSVVEATQKHDTKEDGFDMDLLVAEVRQLRQQLQQTVNNNNLLRDKLDQLNDGLTDTMLTNTTSASRLAQDGPRLDSNLTTDGQVNGGTHSLADVLVGGQRQIDHIEMITSVQSHYQHNGFNPGSPSATSANKRVSLPDRAAGTYSLMVNGCMTSPPTKLSDNTLQQRAEDALNVSSRNASVLSDQISRLQQGVPRRHLALNDADSADRYGSGLHDDRLLVQDNHDLARIGAYPFPSQGTTYSIYDPQRPPNCQPNDVSVPSNAKEQPNCADESLRRIGSDLRSLYTICVLDDFELLRKQIDESHVMVAGMESRVSGRLAAYRHCSPTQSIEVSTLRELSQSLCQLRVTITTERQLVSRCWHSELPPRHSRAAEISLRAQNKELTDELGSMRSKYGFLKQELKTALKKLQRNNKMKLEMEKQITRQLSKTRTTMEQARANAC